jgi:serine/threonine-protein kinase HipA
MSSERPDELVVVLDAPELGPRRPVGVLRRRAGPRPVLSFEYARTWREGPALAIFDPSLPLVEGEQFVGGDLLPGILSDTAPDRWGRRLLERREASTARHEGRAPRRLQEWDFLTGVDDRTRMGALRLAMTPDGPFASEHHSPIPPQTRLRTLEVAARQADDPATPGPTDAEVAMLLAPGSSLGGARPKANFADPNGHLWIAKFPSTIDRRDIGAWEYLLATLARRAGIAVADSERLTLSPTGSTFAARRFDRVGSERRLYASAMTLTGKRDGEDASYLDIAFAIADHGDPEVIAQDLEQLFRRVVFNVLVGNRDDHLRNHGFLCGPGGWRLAPAFDVNPTPDTPDHALAIDDNSHEPDLGIVLATAPFYRVPKPSAEQVIREVKSVTDTWRSEARRFAFPADEINLVGTAFVSSQ